MFKNVASQNLTLYAVDASTGLPKTGDSANMVFYVSKDDGSVTAIAGNSGVPTEIDSTNAKGLYKIALSQTETNADKLLFSGKSSTTNIVVVPAVIYTLPNRFSTLVIDSAGLADANAVKVGPTGSGTAQTARDLGASVLLSTGTGTGQLDFTSGVVKGNITQLLGTAWLTPGTAGTPDVNTKLVGGVAQTGGDLYPAVSNIAVTSAALNTTASAATITTGTQTNTYTSTATSDGVYHSVADSAGTVDFYYQFDISGTSGAVGVGVEWQGYVVGVVNTIKVYAFNWGGSSWDQVGTIVGIAGTVNMTQDWELTSAHTGTAGNAGLVRIRFNATGLTSSSTKTDRILLGYAVVITLPTNFSSLAIDGSGRIDLGKWIGTAPLSLSSQQVQAIVPDTQKVDVNTIKTNPVVNGGTITFPTGATLASTTNITAGTITTTTNLTNLPAITAGWLTATGIAADAITAAKIADNAIDKATFAADTGLRSLANGTATAGGSTDITLAVGSNANDDFYNGAAIVLVSGTGAGQYRLITDYVGSTRVATVDPWVTNPDNTSVYAIVPWGGLLPTPIRAAIGLGGANLDNQLNALSALISSTTLTTDAIAVGVWTHSSGSSFATVGTPGHALMHQLRDAFTTASSSIFTSGALANGPGGGSVTLGSTGLDAVTIESGINARQALSEILAAVLGLISGLPSSPATVKNSAGTATRATVTFDADNNRTTVVLHPPT